MNHEPTVSVVIPTYNRPQKLTRAVESVVRQTYSDWELIVVNDDPNGDISSYLPDDSRIRQIQHKKNRGAPMARNNGICASKGRYIALLDDDDVWKPNKLGRQVDRIQSVDQSFGMIYTGGDTVYNGRVVSEFIPDKEGFLYESLLGHNFIPSESPLIKKECFEEVGLFDPNFPSCQDMDMWIRIAKEYKIAAVQESLVVSYLGHDDRISKDYERKYQGHKRLIEKHREGMESNPDAIAKQRRKLGLYAVATGRNTEAVELLTKAYRHDLSNWPLVLYTIMALLPPIISTKAFRVREWVIRRI